MAAVQYTFTHKQYTEQQKTNNTQNNTKILEGCGPCPVLYFTQSLRVNYRVTLRLGHYRSLLGPLQFTIHQSPERWHYIVIHTDRILQYAKQLTF